MENTGEPGMPWQNRVFAPEYLYNNILNIAGKPKIYLGSQLLICNIIFNINQAFCLPFDRLHRAAIIYDQNLFNLLNFTAVDLVRKVVILYKSLCACFGLGFTV